MSQSFIMRACTPGWNCARLSAKVSQENVSVLALGGNLDFSVSLGCNSCVCGLAKAKLAGSLISGHISAEVNISPSFSDCLQRSVILLL